MSELLLSSCEKIPWRQLWSGDNFDICFRKLFIEQAVPAVVVLLSTVILVVSLVNYYCSGAVLRSDSLHPSFLQRLPLLSRTRRDRTGYGATAATLVAESARRRRMGRDDQSSNKSYHDRNPDADVSRSASESTSTSTTVSDSGIQTQPCLSLSIRDMALVVMTCAQLLIAYALTSGWLRGNMSSYEVGLWAWAGMLCLYLLYRGSSRMPSPSPHLRFVFTAGLCIDLTRARTALLAYTHGEAAGFPVAELAMAGFAVILFLASFTQQRRRHGLPPNLPAGTSHARPPCPEQTASIAQLLFFSWMDPMIWLGYKRPLEPDDLYDLMPNDHAERVCAKWRSACSRYSHDHGGDSRTLIRKLFWFFRYRLALQCVWSLLYTAFIFASPLLLKRILAYMEDPSLYTREQAFWFVAGLLVSKTLVTICQSQVLWIGRKIGIHIKCIITGDVYAKSLLRRDAATNNSKDEAADVGPGKTGGTLDDSGNADNDASSLGKITNLMAVDAHKVAEGSSYLHFIYELPALIIVTVIMLYQLLGAAVLGCIGAILVFGPIQLWLVSIWRVYQNQLMKISDRRMSMMNEILQGVRIIKFFAWEPQFERQVAGVRGSELNVLHQRYLMFSYSVVLFFMAPVFITLATFTVYTKVMGQQLTASVAFTALVLFKTLRGPLDQLPDFFSFCLQAKVSVDRVEKFLYEEDTPKYELSRLSRRTHDAFIDSARDPTYADVVAATDVGFVNASFSWKPAATWKESRQSRGAQGRINVLPSVPLENSETEPLLSELNAVAASAVARNTNASEISVSSPVYATTPGLNYGASADETFELRNLTVNFPVGKLSIIAGPTGSGKTSMLMALLGEMLLVDGQVMVPGAVFDTHAVLGEEAQDPFALHESVAYVAQQAWLLNDTIRGNITFGLPYDDRRYSEVIRMCALTRDFEVLDAGDMTEVGERGVVLSGGQKQRICLARAVYSPARHVIMDDCLSAVDAHTAKHLFENCLMSPLMAERTRILVTHAVGLTVRGASAVVVMQDGKIAAAGTYAEVLRSGKLSEETLREANEEQQNSASKTEINDAGRAGSPDHSLADDHISAIFDDVDRSGKPNNSKPSAGADSDTERGKLTAEEGWSRGHVQWRVYTEYIKSSGGLLLWLGLALLFLVGQGLQVAQDWWLREWAASYGRPAGNDAQRSGFSAEVSLLPEIWPGSGNGEISTFQQRLLIPGGLGSVGMDADRAAANSKEWVNLWYFIGVYTVIALASVVIILGRSLMQFWSSIKASKVLHERLLHTILRAPIRFFDTTPVGRLINRFSKDMETIDQSLSSSLAIFITELTASLAILVVISVITPAFIVGAIIIAVTYWIIGVLYLSTSREIKRFESVTKSPIYTHFGETLNGVSTIRAYGQEARFKKTNYSKIDDNIRPFIYMWGANRWLSIRVDLAGAFVSCLAGLLALTATGGRMDAGLAGMSLSYALDFTQHILWVVRFYSINEMNLNSVERVVEYLDVTPEAPVTIPDRTPPAEWPAEGRISVENLVLRYAESLPPVIHGISFEVQPREKIGIVGRTGAGKSSLTLAMLRIVEASAGRIVVDGIDISQIGVGDLRSQLTIIPQDPVLFTGTIRNNLDPFNKHSDSELWLALRRAHLLGEEGSEAAARSSGSTISTHGIAGSSKSSSIIQHEGTAAVGLGRTISGLDMAVSENGSNFSQGQRQLIALARALVKHTRVIILDEATASVDFDTDAKIQATIRNEFTESTLLCIAHRLRTIVDYDRVLVLDQGKVVEFDTPYRLLSKSEGVFRHMCLRSGEYDHLFAAAERKHHVSCDNG
ncbi:Transporter of the ATP-binding cassette (ABC) [Coemansia sp. RSA 988]|nr:Transporter of the ATP-binding cassette (ABC) [Coemansia sp. RSA 988]